MLFDVPVGHGLTSVPGAILSELRKSNRTPGFSVLAMLPWLFWSGPPDTAAALRRAGIDRFFAPAKWVDGWKALPGFTVRPMTEEALRARIQLAPPGIDYKVNVASATSAPWIDANGWRFRRAPGKPFWSEVPAGKAALAAAEAFAYDADALFSIQPEDLDGFAKMLGLLRSIPERNLPEVADFGFIDNGSESAAEILNLLNRRNLLYKIVKTPDARLRLNVAANDDDPHLFAAKVREKLGDDERSLRVYGSEVVLCRLTGDAAGMRVHVLNYGRNRLEGVRLRVRGSFAHGKVYGLEEERPLGDWTVAGGFTEFSIPSLGAYAVIDLTR